MPYVDAEIRRALEMAIQSLGADIQKFADVKVAKRGIIGFHDNESIMEAAGILNYTITSLVLYTLGSVEVPTYAKLALMDGVLSTAREELYRKVSAPYEDKKCAENGEVYSDEDVLSFLDIGPDGRSN